MAIKRVGLIEEVLEDKRVVKYRSSIAKLRKKDLSSANLEEMKNMHALRLENKAITRKLVESSQNDLIDMVMRNQAYRSRCAAIKMETTKAHMHVESHTAAIIKYVIATYGNEVTAATGGAKTKADREGFVESLLANEMKYLARLATVIKISNILIEDLDQAGWAVQRVTAILQITQGKGAATRI